MRVFSDIISNDELFSDGNAKAITEVENKMFYKYTGKMVSEANADIDESLIGGNKSAEAPVEDVCTDLEGGPPQFELVVRHQLASTCFGTKKDLQAFLKGYVRRLFKILKEEGDAEKLAEFKAGAEDAIKFLTKKHSSWEFFTGESQNPDGAIGFLDFDEETDTPYMLFFKHGIKSEKC